jgi:hypothetical protein
MKQQTLETKAKQHTLENITLTEEKDFDINPNFMNFKIIGEELLF